VDIAARFREYVRLDRKRSGEGLTPAELQRLRALKGYLNRHFSGGGDLHVDTRRSLRVPTRVNVRFESDDAFAKSVMTNISRHGVFVQTEHPQEIKSKFDLRIQIENPPREITVPVEVVSVGIGPTFQANEQGMGLRFLEADPDVERQLRELYESALS
jgi:uncharacterized protein (TIGR02266 family)